MKCVDMQDGTKQIVFTHDDAKRYFNEFECDVTKEIPESIASEVADRLSADIKESVADAIDRQLYDSHDQSFKDSLERDGYVGYDGYKNWKRNLRQRTCF